MKDFKSVTNTVLRHGKILFRGFTRMLYGTMTAITFAMAIYGFAMISREGGWAAVCEFVGAVATTCVAVTCMYAQGGGKRKRGGFEK
jgi:hypothetical protein